MIITTTTLLFTGFYTLVPHACSRAQKLPMLGSVEAVKTKMKLLETLQDVEIAVTLVKDTSKGKNEQRSKMDQNYGLLKCDIEPLDRKSQEFKVIQQYVTNSWVSSWK